MADFWGLEQIATRMHVDPQTIRRWHRELGFLMYPRRRGPRTIWFTNDALILHWEIARSSQARGKKLATTTPYQRSPKR